MIVRIQGEGQWELSAAQVDELNRIDDQLVDIIKRNDGSTFEATLTRLLEYVRGHGRSLKPEEIMESELILPPADATIDEVKKVFSDEGLIPG